MEAMGSCCISTDPWALWEADVLRMCIAISPEVTMRSNATGRRARRNGSSSPINARGTFHLLIASQAYIPFSRATTLPPNVGSGPWLGAGKAPIDYQPPPRSTACWLELAHKPKRRPVGMPPAAAIG